MSKTSAAEKPQKQKSFYGMVFSIVLPILIQNLIHTAVNSADVIMLGYVNQTALSASSLANQPFGILSFIFYGVGSGCSILASQYWGKKDLKTIERVLGIALRLALGFAAVFFIAGFFFPTYVMRIYTNEKELIEVGAVYLRIISLTYLMTAVTQMYLNVQRCLERVKLSTIILSISLFINVILNACFIFGLAFYPKLGLIGVAIATCIARLFELTFCIVDSFRNKLVKIRIPYIWARNAQLFKDFMKYSLPALCNDIVASVGWSMYSVIMGHLGTDVVAANSIAVVARSFGNVFCSGISSSCSIILGRTLGENKLELAKDYAKRFLRLALIFGTCGGLFVLAMRPVFINMADLSEQATEYLGTMLIIQSYYLLGMTLNTCWIGSIFRAGGDSKFGFICDTITIWAWVVPVGFLLAFVLELPPMAVYFFLLFDEFFKMPFVYRHYKKYGWLKNITRDLQ